MADKRKNLKVPPEVFEELDAGRDMCWPDYLLYLRRMATVAERLDGSEP